MSYHSNPLSHQRAPPKKLQIILVNTIHDNKSSLLEVSSWITVSELKSKIEKAFGVPVAQQRLFFQTQELNQNNFSMTSLGGKKRIKLILRPTPNLENTMGLVKKYETLPKQDSLDSLLFSVQEGFNVGLIPKLTFDGTSGSYFLQNKYRKNVAIFKPFDEEPFAPNNPKGYIGKLGSPGFRGGILSGESAIREVVAYLLDDRGFSGVPPTTFVEIIHPYFSKRDMKEAEISQGNSIIPIQNFTQYTDKDRKNIIKHGSLQKFVEGAEEASDYGPKLFPDEEVRKIAMLDLRILNCDRNEGNILVKKEKGIIKLTPIDHGLSFPDSFQACTYDLVWMEWPQAKKKWTPLELDYISRINPKSDTEKIAKHFKFRDICLRNFRIAETVLKRCATAGMLLYDIGNILYREDPDFPSPIEEIVRKTEELCHTIQSTVPRGIAHILKKAPRINGMKERRMKEEEKENNGINRGKACGHRTRAFSEDISMFEEEEQLQSQKIFQSILEQTNQSDLFTIPELTRPLDGSHLHKSGKIQNVGSDHTLSEDDNDLENEIDRSLHEDAPNKYLRRSSSIPAFLSRIPSEEKESSKENGKDAPKENSVFYTSKRVTTKGLSRLQDKKDRIPKHMDELFFKYFDGFLEQKIEIVMKNKQAPPTRSRFYSDM